MLALLTAFLGSIGTVLSLNAELTFHCDNIGTAFISQDGGDTYSQKYTEDHFPTPYRLTIYGVTCDTIVVIRCQDVGVVGGFIATINYDGQDYYTTNPLTDSNWEVLHATDDIISPLVYSPKISAPWAFPPWDVNTAEINSNAHWVWNGQTNNVMIFGFNFGNLDFCNCNCECKDPPTWNYNPCHGAPNGNYINCADPNSFVMCSNGYGYKQPCPGVHWGQPQLVFDPCAGPYGECRAPGSDFECEGPSPPVPGPCECRSDCKGVGADWQNFKPCPGTDGCAPTGYIACGVWGQTTHFMPCPAGLEFDPTKGDPQSGQCVLPHEVECHCGSECDP